ncbi:MAG: hypothetical protein JWN30_2869, partial [Bacilli bacterium]|nr:hypothetical protein [Bacilli bacterium]
DDRKDLFVIKEQTEQGLIVEYPGETFTARILTVIGDLFFIKLQETDTQKETRFALGAYFEIAGEGYGAYYELAAKQAQLVFFGIHTNGESYQVVELSDEDYQRVSAEFSTTYAGILNFE